MANKTIVQLTSKPTLTTADLIPVGDASTAILYKRTIADLLGAGNAVTSTTGTANYLPKFTSANVLGNSQIYDNGTNVGIGTTSPAYKLDVNGTGMFRSNLFLNQDSGGYVQQSYQYGGVTKGFLYWENGSSSFNIGSASELRLFSNNTERMRITSAGNVGIGTTAPAYKLHTLDNNNSFNISTIFENSNTGTSAQNAIRLKAGTNSITLGLTNQNNTLTGTYLIADQLTPLIFGTNSIERIRIASTGNVGIGVTSPAYKLDVNGDININGVFRINGTPISSGGGGTGTITGSGTTTYIPKWTSSSALGDSPIAVDGSNNVTIGSTVYTHKFNVLVNTSAYQSFTTYTANNWLVIKAHDGAGAYKTQVYDAYNHFWYVSNASKMFLSENGDLYLNQSTFSGTYKLDVNGAIRSTVDVIITSDKRVKDNIINVTDALNKVDAMQGVYYTRKDLTNNKQYIGFLAQDLEGTLPQVVNQDSLGNYGVSYGNITALHNEAIKELNKEIKHLKSIINGFTK